MSRQFKFRRLTAEQFRAALKQLGISGATEFARMYDCAPDRARRWLNGTDDIPHSVSLVLALMTLPGGRDMAEALFNQMVVDLSEAEKRAIARREAGGVDEE